MAGLGLIHKKIVELFPDIDEQYFADLLSPQSKLEFGEPGRRLKDCYNGWSKEQMKDFMNGWMIGGMKE